MTLQKTLLPVEAQVPHINIPGEPQEMDAQLLDFLEAEKVTAIPLFRNQKKLLLFFV